MAISYLSSAFGVTTSTTVFTITLPTTASNDIMLLEFLHRSLADASSISGSSVTTDGLTWTKKHDQYFATSAYSGKMYWTRATGDHSGKTVRVQGLTNSCAGIVTVYRGVMTSGDPLTRATIVGEQNASANETQAAVSTDTAGCMICLTVLNSPDLAVSGQSCATLGAMTERSELLSTGGTDTSISHASVLQGAAGNTGAFTWAQTDAASGSYAYALEPAPETQNALLRMLLMHAASAYYAT